MDTIHILIVEDNPGDARLIREYLKSDTSVNFSIHYTTTLADSLETLANKKFDVVLVDLGLPDSQGIYTFNAIIKANPHSPVVIITGNDDEKIGLEAVRHGAQNYLVKNQINANLLIRTIKYAIEIKHINIALKESQQKYHAIFEDAASLIITINPDGDIINCNNRIQQLLGYEKKDLIGRPIQNFLHPDSFENAKKSIKEMFSASLLKIGKLKMIRKNGEVIFTEIRSSVIQDKNSNQLNASCIIDNITERITHEKQQQFTTRILNILNRKNEWSNLVQDILKEVKDFTEIEAVAIRYKENQDYPYFETLCFPNSFINKENYLCTTDKKGEIVYDSGGKPLLECMCGHIISKRTDASLHFFTRGGSFWTNSTTDLVSTVTEAEIQYFTRDNCNKAGYESVALIPLHSENEIIGLLQLNDKHKNRFNKEMIYFLEEMGSIIGIAFKRMGAEKTIYESELRYRGLFESAKDGILIINASNGQIIDVNPFLIEMMEYTHEEFIGRELWEIGIFKNIAASKEAFLELQNKKYIRFEDMPLETRNGKHIDVEFISNVYLVNHKKVIQCNIRDITERKQVEEQIIYAKEKAEDSDRLKTAFLHNISHEIRTPMNAIMGFSAFLNRPDLTAEKRQYYIDVITQSSNQLLSIIEDIISIATIEAGQEKLEENEVNINAMCRLTHEQYLQKAQVQNVILECNTPLPDDEAYFMTDKIKLFQVLNNVVNNALKFTKQGYVNFGYKVMKKYVEFFVEDSGIGIPEDMFEEIFKRFRQVDSRHEYAYGGSGLGLSISKAYIELLGGNIWLTSEINKGSTFYFTIPYIRTKPIKVTSEEPPAEFKTGNEKGKTILIAEDEDFNFLFLEELFNETNFKIIRACNGAEAISICKTNTSIDLVLMDIKMPIINGYEAAKKIREFRPDLPIIAQTAYTSDLDRDNTIASGCNDFISKPFTRELIFSKIEEQLGAK